MIYNYCVSNTTKNLNLSCDIYSISKIHSYDLRNGEFQIEIYKCNQCKGLWKRTKFNNITKWLKVGDVTMKQEEYVPFDSVGYYPIEYFETDEAYVYDNSIFCGNPKEFKKYHGLTCSPKTLSIIEQIETEDIGCYSSKTEVCSCKKCGTKWKLIVIFDSHHGYARSAKKVF